MDQRTDGEEKMDLFGFVRYMEELAHIDGTFCWNVNLGERPNMLAGYMNLGVVKELFADSKCV